MKLAIISHTEHYLNKAGMIVGWGPTIREVNYLSQLFDEIWHIAVLHKGEPPSSAFAYSSENIHFVPLSPFGGPSIYDKLDTIRMAPKIVSLVQSILDKVDYWQFRSPTGIGVFLVPWLSRINRKPGWFKYAGNWKEPNPPLAFRWQRFWLKNFQKKPVTINGSWNGQPKHCLSFENPCLGIDDIENGEASLLRKNYREKLNFCFVGRVENAKGVNHILKALKQTHSKRIGTIHFVGDGPEKTTVEQATNELPFELKIHGSLERSAINAIYAKSHFIFLPSLSEGFPKVIAEGMAFGCIPITSSISSIPQYIKHEMNGFLWNLSNPFEDWFNDWINKIDRFDLKTIAEEAYQTSTLFTYERYLQRIKSEILLK